MDTFGARLREERTRAGLSQTECGKLGGVQKLAQIEYENGDRTPNAAYMAALLSTGLDVPYIVTGKRSEPDTLATWALAAATTAGAVGLTDNTRASLREKILEGMTARVPPPASSEERFLLQRFRDCDESGMACALRVVTALAAQARKPHDTKGK